MSTAASIASVASIANQNGKVVEAWTLNPSLVEAGTDKTYVTRLNADGSVDSSFGSNGAQLISIVSGGVTYGVLADDIVVQSNGNIDMLGTATATSSTLPSSGAIDFVVAQLTPGGQLDTTFGTSGFQLIDFSKLTSSSVPASTATALALDPSGKIVAVGFTTTSSGSEDFAIARLNTNGSFDTSFNTSGMAVVAVPLASAGGSTDARANAVVVQPDGKIVAAGLAEPMQGPGVVEQDAVVRLNTDGTLDTSFNGTGVLTYNYNVGGNSDDFAAAVALQGTQIVVAGTTSVISPPGSNLNPAQLTVTRLNANGTFDTTFNGSGKFILTITSGGITFTTSASAVNVLSDGTILVGGSASEANTFGLTPAAALVELTTGAALDTSFGSSGVALLPTRLTGRMLVQTDGKILFPNGSGVARTTTTASALAITNTALTTTGMGKNSRATGLTVGFNTGIDPVLATNVNIYQVKTVKGNKVVKLRKKSPITYDASSQTLTIHFASKTAVGKGFQVVLSPGAIVAADGQVLSTNTIVV
jgi:uncharacterized delta-60 repeat protein